MAVFFVALEKETASLGTLCKAFSQAQQDVLNKAGIKTSGGNMT